MGACCSKALKEYYYTTGSVSGVGLATRRTITESHYQYRAFVGFNKVIFVTNFQLLITIVNIRIQACGGKLR